MTSKRIPVLPSEDSNFAALVRFANPPRDESATSTVFLPAYATVSLGQTEKMDLSYFFQPPEQNPLARSRSQFDRHLRSEELWVIARGAGIVPLAPCRTANDLDELPDPERMVCLPFRAGDLFVLRPNVWHCGPWALRASEPIEFYMCLSGHRQDPSGGTVDHVVKSMDHEAGVLPDIDQAQGLLISNTEPRDTMGHA